MKNLLNKYYDLNIKNIIKNAESTDGNVYIIETDNNKYILKIYKDLKHTKNMINLFNILNELFIPSVIKTKDNLNYLEYDGVYYVIYTFLDGIGIYNYSNFDNLVPLIAKEVKKMHDLSKENVGLDSIPFKDNHKLDRYSAIHFDLTKHNIFYNEKKNKIGFIDFDDAKYGPSICDIAIIISLLFLSKKSGVNKEGIKLFIDNYYQNDVELKNKELKYLKEYALLWVNYLLDNVNFESSIKESFEVKKQLINNYL